MAQSTEDLIGSTEAAALLNLSVRHVRILAREGKLPCWKKANGRLLFSPRSLRIHQKPVRLKPKKTGR